MLVAVAFEADKFEFDKYVDTQLSHETDSTETLHGFGAESGR